MSAIVHTVYSTYEVDTENKRIRRVQGLNAPTNAIAEDGVWRDYVEIKEFYDSLLILWADVNPDTGLQRATRTSDIVKIEGDLGIPDMLVVELP